MATCCATCSRSDTAGRPTSARDIAGAPTRRDPLDLVAGPNPKEASGQKPLVLGGNGADIEGVEAARIAWRPLGRLLVEQGLLTDDELERALVLQQATGKRLGETIVELGFVSGPDLASALEIGRAHV